LKTFEELGVNENIRHAIEDLGFEQPMPVQEEVIPYLLGNQNDVIALAQTGTGKTAAYGLPLLQKLDPDVEGTQAIVLSPTRELCNQIADDLNSFAKYLDHAQVIPVYGGASIMTQIHELRHNVPIVAATPGRMIDLMNRGALKLDQVKTIILDEADEMLNMGFSDSINEIFEHLPEGHTTWMFSATMTKEVEKVAKNYLHDYKEIVVGSRNEGAENVNHIYYMVNARDKYLALKRVVDFYPHIYAIIFCRTKRETQEIADKLIHDGYNAEALHGDLSQDQRDLTMQKFRQHTTQLLVATDVAARGLDVEDLTHVINFGLPDDIESYTHRSGRTGRAGKKGTSISIIHSRERGKVRQIEKEIGKEFVDGTLPTPEEICQKQLYKTMDDIMKTDVDEDLIAPYMDEINRQFEYVDKEDVIKKMVTITFGRFLNYYKNAPAIEKPSSSRRSNDDRRSEGGRGRVSHGRRSHGAEAGYTRLFINLGKADGFYPGEVMQYVNKHVHGRQEIGHIDLLSKFSYIEVPQGDSDRVMHALDGTTYKGREVRCNAADESGHGNSYGSGRHDHSDRRKGDYARNRQGRKYASEKHQGTTHDHSSEKKDDWRGLMTQAQDFKFKDKEPDFSEEGWARRKPKKSKE
jgi:ATP-dependent RNA helicase DeaD